MEKLANFLIKAKINTYASQGEGGENILEDGCKELNFKEDDFKYRDRYFGSNPFIGEEVVWQDEKLVWGMNYYGATISNEIDTKIVYNFLKEALKKVAIDIPFRGPKEFKQDDFRYINKVNSDVYIFSGEEEIYFKDELIYKLKYHGGRM